MSCGHPPERQQNLSSPINLLNDIDLEQIFKWLPPLDRLIAAEVCRRWHGVARKSWLDVKLLDLRPIPGKQVNAVLKQCTNVKSVFAAKTDYSSRQLSFLGKQHPSLSSVKFYSCFLAVDICNNSGIIPGVFSEEFQQSQCTEFIMHDAYFHAGVKHALGSVVHAGLLPACLTHLQLSNLCLETRFFDKNEGFLQHGLERLTNLECLILLDAIDKDENTQRPISSAIYYIGGKGRGVVFATICGLKNLKELCIGSPVILLSAALDDLIQCLPKLQVLFIHDLHIIMDPAEYQNGVEYNMQAIASSASLRILVLLGRMRFMPVAFPVRKRYPNGFDEDPLPLLHIFVGDGASKSIRFAKSEMNAAIAHPINQPFLEFLVRAEIAPIFDGVWVAERIKESEHYSGQLWDHKSDDTAVSAH